MKMKQYFAGIGGAMTLATGCSEVNFYDTSVSSSDRSGFLYDPPKPYILNSDRRFSVSKIDRGLPEDHATYRGIFSRAVRAVDWPIEKNN